MTHGAVSYQSWRSYRTVHFFFSLVVRAAAFVCEVGASSSQILSMLWEAVFMRVVTRRILSRRMPEKYLLSCTVVKGVKKAFIHRGDNEPCDGARGTNVETARFDELPRQ